MKFDFFGLFIWETFSQDVDTFENFETTISKVKFKFQNIKKTKKLREYLTPKN